MIRRGLSRHRAVAVRRRAPSAVIAPLRRPEPSPRAPRLVAAAGLLAFALGVSGMLRSVELVALCTTLGLSLLLVALALRDER